MGLKGIDLPLSLRVIIKHTSLKIVSRADS
jgi:hypothetical protein